MANQINAVSIKLNDSKKFIKANVELQLQNRTAPRIYIAGAPGCGKSDLMRQVCRENGWGLAVKYISNMALEQLTGLPVKPEKGSETAWSKPEIFNFSNLEYRPDNYKEGVTPTVLLLDDFHLLDKMMQKYMFQLLTYMGLNGYCLPKNTAVVMAGNRMSDKACAMPIPAPVCNRMMFVDVHSDAEDWLKNFAFVNNVRNDVCTFINSNKHYLHGEPIETSAWASPRSWTFLSNQMDVYEKMNSLNIEDLKILATGLLGDEIASEFMLYRELFSKWNFKELFLDKAVNEKIKEALMDNALNAYAIINAAISWMITEYQDANYELTEDVTKKVKFIYNTLGYMLTVKTKSANIGPMMIAGMKYLNILQDVKIGKDGDCYKNLMKTFFSEMTKKRNADWLFFDIVKEIAGERLTKEQQEKVNEAKKSVA